MVIDASVAIKRCFTFTSCKRLSTIRNLPKHSRRHTTYSFWPSVRQLPFHRVCRIIAPHLLNIKRIAASRIYPTADLSRPSSDNPQPVRRKTLGGEAFQCVRDGSVAVSMRACGALQHLRE